MRVSTSGRFLSSIVSELKEGKAALSVIQREYCWSKLDVEEFWKSMMAGYPVGGITLWEIYKSGPLYQENMGPEKSELYNPDWYTLVLDGQNRLVTMLWSAHDFDTPVHDIDALSEMEIDTWLSGERLVADTENKVIRFIPEAELDLTKNIPMSVVCERARFFMFARENGLSEEQLVWVADAVHPAIQNVKMAATTIERATPAEAAEVFRLINKTGQPVSDADIEKAFKIAEDIENAAAVAP